jgi:Fic family protein
MINSNGRRSGKFEPVPASEVDEAMKQLTSAYLAARNNYNINQLILIPCFILDFLAIYPFSAGNERLSRLLSLLLLNKSGFDVGRYVSFEKEINYSRDKYNLALRESLKKWHEGKNSYGPFIVNFMSTVLYCYKELDKQFAIVNNKNVSKQQLVRAVILSSLSPISKSEICNILPDVSMATIERVLYDLHKTNVIRTVGKGKNTIYIEIDESRNEEL